MALSRTMFAVAREPSRVSGRAKGNSLPLEVRNATEERDPENAPSIREGLRELDRLSFDFAPSFPLPMITISDAACRMCTFQHQNLDISIAENRQGTSLPSLPLTVHY